MKDSRNLKENRKKRNETIHDERKMRDSMQSYGGIIYTFSPKMFDRFVVAFFSILRFLKVVQEDGNLQSQSKSK